MKIVCISDTHGQHKSLNLPKGDCLIHCGDFCKFGHLNDGLNFMNWLEEQDFKYKIVVAGNHDLFVEHNHSVVKRLFAERLCSTNRS